MAAKPVLPTAQVTRTRFELTPEIVTAAKEFLRENGLPEDIYKIQFEEDVFLIRPLFAPDWNRILTWNQEHPNIRGDELDLKICELGIVWPQEVLHPAVWTAQRAGYQSTLARFIQDKSGFYDPQLDQSAYLSVESLVELEDGPQPDEATIRELKQKYNWDLYKVHVGRDWYVVRPMNRQEWQTITQNSTKETVDLNMSAKVCIWSRHYPEKPNFEKVLAGVPRMLAEVAMVASGFNVEPTVEKL